jgi:hypothetical protein
VTIDKLKLVKPERKKVLLNEQNLECGGGSDIDKQ